MRWNVHAMPDRDGAEEVIAVEAQRFSVVQGFLLLFDRVPGDDREMIMRASFAPSTWMRVVPHEPDDGEADS